MIKSQSDIKTVIDQIQTLEGEGFECREQEVSSEVLKSISNKTSLIVKILIVIGALMASGFLSSFLFMTGLEKSGFGMVGVGAMLILGTILLRRVSGELFIETLCVAYFITGYFLLGFGCGLLKLSENQTILCFISISVAVFFLTKNFLLYLVAFIVFSGSILGFIYGNKYYELIHLYILIYACLMVWLSLNESFIITRYRKLTSLYNAVRIGIIISLLMGLAWIGNKNILPINIQMIWISSAVCIALILFLTNHILNKLGVENNRIFIFMVTGIVLLTTVLSPAISGGMLIFLLCFLVNFKLGFAIGIVATIYFIVQFYSDLNESLLVKSMLLLGAGILFLVFYFFTDKYLSSDEKI